jgi:DNA-directed RNA polymerase specialized sigma24 family protein
MSGAAWDLIVPAISPRLRSRLRRFLRRSHTPGDAEDLLQEAFLRVLQAEAAGRIAPRDLGSYLWRVADRVASDHARRLRTQKRGGGIFTHQLIGTEVIPDLRPGPEALAMLALDSQALLR